METQYRLLVFLLVLQCFVHQSGGQYEDYYYNYDYKDYEDPYDNPTELFAHGGEYCTNHATCLQGHTSMMSYPQKNCNCDEICAINNDCCPDFTPSLNQSVVSSQMSCHSFKEIQANPRFGYLLADKCRAGHNIPEIASKCEDPVTGDDFTLFLPVTSNTTHVVYKNMYCAFCNYDFEILYWYVEIRCLSNEGDFLPDNRTTCEYLFWPPNEIQDARLCPNRDVVEDCPVEYGVGTTEVQLKENCSQQAVEYVYVETTMYKNVYCAKCNSLSDDIICIQLEFETTSVGPTPTQEPKYTFRLLIDFNSNQATRDDEDPVEIPVVCRDDELFDPYTGDCRTIYCWEPRVARRGKCVLGSDTPLERSQISVSSLNGNGMDKNCTLVKYTQSEYRFINVSAVFIISLGKVYSMSDVYLQDTNLFVCADANQTCGEDCNQPKPMFDFDKSEELLSYATLSISVVSLLFTLVVYLSFPVLLNTPGKILVCLIISLFFGQLSFLVAETAEGYSGLCAFIAVTIHFSYLSAFFWVNIIALDLWMTFSKQFISAGSESKSSKRMYYYGAFAWGCPLFVIISALIVDNVEMGGKFETIKPLYGKYSCWVGSNHALILFFVGPAALSQLFNMVSFVFTSCHISRANKHGAMARGQADTCTLLIIFKLSLVMGLTWVFAFVANISDDDVFWYIFIILNALQGLYICICFVCTRKVIRLLQQKVEEITQTRSSTTRMTSLEKSNEKKRSV